MGYTNLLSNGFDGFEIVQFHVQQVFKKRGWKMKKFTNTNLAISTSVFILISVIYSLIINAPIYKFTLFLHNATMIVSIITLAIHFNALKENKEKKKLILLSIVVPIAVLIYFIIGLIYWGNSGN